MSLRRWLGRSGIEACEHRHEPERGQPKLEFCGQALPLEPQSLGHNGFNIKTVIPKSKLGNQDFNIKTIIPKSKLGLTKISTSTPLDKLILHLLRIIHRFAPNASLTVFSDHPMLECQARHAQHHKIR